MRVGALLGLVIAGACSSGTGADIEIRSELPLASVEVFVASSYCSMPDPSRPDSGALVPCSKYGIAWVAGQPAPEQREDGLYDQIYVSVADRGQQIELEPLAQQDGGTWQLHLDADRDSNALKIIIVGYDAEGTAIAVGAIDESIPINSAVHWTITLAPADAASLDDMDEPDADEHPVRVHAWGRDEASPDAARCVVMQHWDGVRWQGVYIVPDSDHDCDAEPIECDSQYYNLNQVTNVCAARGTDPDGACTIGVSTCQDGRNADHQCDVLVSSASNVTCLPDGFCEQCPGPYGLAQCAREAVRSDLVNHVSCRFAGAADGRACGPGFVGSKASALLPETCQAIEVRSLTNVLDDVSMPVKTIGVNGDTATFSVALENQGVGCKVIVTFESGVAQRGDSSWVIVAITPANSLTTRLLVPFELVFEDFEVDCSQPLSTPVACDTVAIQGDHIWSCAY